MAPSSSLGELPTVPVDDAWMPYDDYVRRLERLRADFENAWQQLGGDNPGWHYWDQELSRFQLELSHLLQDRLKATILEEYGDDLDGQDLTYILLHAIRLAWLLEDGLRRQYLGETARTQASVFSRIQDQLSS